MKAVGVVGKSAEFWHCMYNEVLKREVRLRAEEAVVCNDLRIALRRVEEVTETRHWWQKQCEKLEEEAKKTPAESGFGKRVRMELKRARKLHPRIGSGHEGWAVLMEELEEFWEEVRKKPAARDLGKMVEELVQVGAMAQRVAEDVCGAGGVTS